MRLRSAEPREDCPAFVRLEEAIQAVITNAMHCKMGYASEFPRAGRRGGGDYWVLPERKQPEVQMILQQQ